MSLYLLDAKALTRHLDSFSDLLHATVHAGASVGFVYPFPPEEARAFWQDKVRPSLRSKGRRLFAMELEGRIAGTVQLGLDHFPNQAHRGEVMKLLVHPDFRRRGIGRALMVTLEAEARRLGRSLLTLDTRSGDPAGTLYRSLGFELAGEIPDYALAPEGDRLDATSYMYKRLR
ncbi:MAG: GNAT family N-acetyltransferase [Alphaproteobacteria bacterium]|nr:MAG: GNAT family N-acetyltransferase [Alphaproteobacteria bacterium]